MSEVRAKKALGQHFLVDLNIARKICDALGGGDAPSAAAAVLPDPAPLEVEAQNIPLDIVYEDGDLLVVNKPKGMVVHPAPGNPDGTLVNALLPHRQADFPAHGFSSGVFPWAWRSGGGDFFSAKNRKWSTSSTAIFFRSVGWRPRGCSTVPSSSLKLP